MRPLGPSDDHESTTSTQAQELARVLFQLSNVWSPGTTVIEPLFIDKPLSAAQVMGAHNQDFQ
jgi:ABC-type hemin transport system ATPase subunit